MSAPKKNQNNAVSAKEAKRRLTALEETRTAKHPKGQIAKAARKLGLSPTSLSRWLITRGIVVGHISAKFNKEECAFHLKALCEKYGRTPTRQEIHFSPLKDYWRTHWHTLNDFVKFAGIDTKLDRERVIRILRGAPTLDLLANRLGLTRGQALDYCDGLKKEGFNVMTRGDRIAIESTPAQLAHDPKLHEFVSDDNGRYRFGVVSDNHLGSKYAREDVLHDLYDWFEREGITRVYNAGNWIDGEARFNRHDLLIHGMDEQLRYFAERYPQRNGITTYYVAGDDHEGWYAKDAGVDIGARAQDTAQKMGRNDLRYLGYMESYIRLKHKISGNNAQLLVVHPGGGSSYAISYAPQKFIEALQGGEKPAVVIFGHWHKMDVFDYRNVWSIQAGTTEDQTPFMRKKKLEAHVGGLIVELDQDPRGAIVGCTPRMKRYFDKGYYNGSFNMGADIVRPPSVLK